MKNKFLNFVLYVFGPLVIAFVVSQLFNTNSYKHLTKPPLAPPSILFPIIWSILYLFMGISLYIVIKKNKNLKSFTKFIVQFIINLIWPFLFFNIKQYSLSAVWILLIIYFTILMIVDFYKIKKIAAYLQFPYIIWLLFALYLNIGVAVLN